MTQRLAWRPDCDPVDSYTHEVIAPTSEYWRCRSCRRTYLPATLNDIHAEMVGGRWLVRNPVAAGRVTRTNPVATRDFVCLCGRSDLQRVAPPVRGVYPPVINLVPVEIALMDAPRKRAGAYRSWPNSLEYVTDVGAAAGALRGGIQASGAMFGGPPVEGDRSPVGSRAAANGLVGGARFGPFVSAYFKAPPSRLQAPMAQRGGHDRTADPYALPCILRLSLNLIDQADTLVSDGDPLSATTRCVSVAEVVHHRPRHSRQWRGMAALLEDIDHLLAGDIVIHDRQAVRRHQAMVLLPGPVESRDIVKVVVPSDEALHYLTAVLGTGIRSRIWVDPHPFA